MAIKSSTNPASIPTPSRSYVYQARRVVEGTHSARVVAPPRRIFGSERLRGALRAFATGVTVVTSAGDGPPGGVTANSFTPVSMVPPLVLVCLRSTSSVLAMIERNGVFAINVLSCDQEPLARRFASPARPRGDAAFADVGHRAQATGAPVLHGVVCWLDCGLVDTVAGGDHLIVIGEIRDFGADSGGDPLIFHAGRYRGVGDRAARAPSLAPISFHVSAERR